MVQVCRRKCSSSRGQAQMPDSRTRSTIGQHQQQAHQVAQHVLGPALWALCQPQLGHLLQSLELAHAVLEGLHDLLQEEDREAGTPHPHCPGARESQTVPEFPDCLSRPRLRGRVA